jgi:hypothetical protein
MRWCARWKKRTSRFRLPEVLVGDVFIPHAETAFFGLIQAAAQACLARVDHAVHAALVIRSGGLRV